MAWILDDDGLLDAADGFAGWDDALEDDTLAQELAQERAVELESELEQDERPIDYDAELEDAEEEAAPTSGKRLKRELRAEALRRLEDAARTAEDFAVVVEEWNKLDRNRERRERDHENLRGDVPLEYQAVPEPRIVPRWLNNPAVRQLCSGNFLDILFDCPYETHQLTANAFLSQMIEELSEEHKEILYFLSLRLYSTTQLAQMRGQSDRNIRKVRNTIRKKLQKKLYAHLCRMQDVEEWNKLDRNRERRERDHENLRGDVPLEYQAVPEPRIVPRWLNNPAVRQLCSGNFLDILFDCPYEMHQLTANAFLSQMIEELSEEHKEILYFLSIRLYSTTQLAQLRGQSDRNIRKVRNTIRKKLQKRLYAHLCQMQDEGKSLTLRERQFMEEYAALLEEKGKDAVIRRENKTKRRKKKAALDGGKDSE